MCGIVAYNGVKQAAPILLKGLNALEYRGYDSSGIAIGENKKINVVKAKGRLKVLEEKTNHGLSMNGHIGIGHTRWATHGEPSENNAHPHISDDGSVVGVHNGIIENYQDIKDKLTRHGYVFYSQTDTEIAVKLIHYYLHKYDQGYIDAISRAMMRMKGSYALAILFDGDLDHVYVAKKDSPMIIGVDESSTYVASDVSALISYTKEVYYIQDDQIGCLGRGDVQFYDLDQQEIQLSKTTITWDVDAVEKNGFEHYMMKEIHEQPKSVKDTLSQYIQDQKIVFHESLINKLQDVKQFTIVACGSAYHAGVIGQYVIEQLARIPVRVELASEYRYRHPIINQQEMVIVISQSGETADSLAALRLANELGLDTLGIVNVVGSSIARDAQDVLQTYAGPEIAVATTKAYSAQLIVLYLLAIQTAYLKKQINQEEYIQYITQLLELPKLMEKTLEDKERIQWFAAKNASKQDMFFIGRGIDYGIALESSLKMKEISYIHSEAYAAGELKHGTISLIEQGILVVGSCTQEQLFEKTVSNLVEIKTRGGYLVGVTSYGNYNIEDVVDFTIYIPKIDPLFSGSLAVIPMQLLAYYLSVAKGLNVDKPRNLAKSVTVE